jgi:hypothetical protein
MEIATAIALLEEVCSNFRGTLADHQQLQTALLTVKTHLGNAERDTSSLSVGDD